MRNVNFALRKSYMAALGDPLQVNVTYPTAATIDVPIYYLIAPESETGKYYITLNQVSNTDRSTKGSSDTNTSMQVQIHTWDNDGNAGQYADDIADKVFEIIYPDSQAKLDMSADDFCMVSTKLDGDNTDELDTGTRIYVTRILTFRHNILHN